VIAEAVDAALAVGWALLVWVVLLAGAATAAMYAGLLAVWGIWRVARSAWGAMGPRTDSLPPLVTEQPTEDPSPLQVSGGRSGPPLRPAWARTDKEAA